MIAIIFESRPHADQRERYLDAAARLKPLLAGIDGFISVERFESLGVVEVASRSLRRLEDLSALTWASMSTRKSGPPRLK